MIEQFGELIFRIAAISIVSSVLRMALPNTATKKYVLFVSGLVVVLCVFTSILTLVKMQEEQRLQMDETFFNIDTSRERIYTSQEKQLLEMCIEKELQNDIAAYTKNNQLVTQIKEVQIEIDETIEDSEKIKEIRIVISEESAIDNKELKYIQKHISEKHLISMNKICFYKEEENE